MERERRVKERRALKQEKKLAAAAAKNAESMPATDSVDQDEAAEAAVAEAQSEQ